MPLFKPDSLKNLLHIILKRARADLEQKFAREKIAVTPFQFKVLYNVQSKPATINGIAREFIMKAPSVVPAVDALESQGFLNRKKDQADGRKIQLMITKKGAELLNKISFDDAHDTLNIAFAKLSLTKQKQLLSILQELIKNFE